MLPRRERARGAQRAAGRAQKEGAGEASTASALDATLTERL